MGNDEMTQSTKYYVWLSLALGSSNPKIKRLQSIYDDISQFYNGAEFEMRFCGIFTENEINRLLSVKLSDAEQIIAHCRNRGYHIIDISSDDYPDSLREIEDPPAVLYVNGKLPNFNSLIPVAIIGTRKATVYGIRTAYELAANLSKQGFVIVSGGALGIDCSAHRGSLEVKGKTICVLGCGLDSDYLRENKAMRAEISKAGAVISEYPPDTPASPKNFPQRNRIISALSKGVVVVEAPIKSGSMITVNFALSQNKDVFAVMGNVDSPYSEGSNALIKDGAIPVTSFRDISEYYLGVSDDIKAFKASSEAIDNVPLKGNKRTDTTKSENKPIPVHRNCSELSEDEKKIYFSLSAEPIHIDDLISKCSVPAHKVLRIISSLEIKDLIINTDGRNYAIK